MTAKVEAFVKEGNPDLSVFLGGFSLIIGICREVVRYGSVIFLGLSGKKRTFYFFLSIVDRGVFALRGGLFFGFIAQRSLFLLKGAFLKMKECFLKMK
ncbi:hypothetical protein, partial [Tannerella sp.]|uniref:hypothetical protein n=1 Tax=Tannerella sp. TaxID=2382127 RepID=UPI0026DD58E9